MFIKSSLRGQKIHKSMNFVHDLATLSAYPVIFVILKFVYPTRAMEYILYFMATRGTHACCHEIQNIFYGTYIF